MSGSRSANRARCRSPQPRTDCAPNTGATRARSRPHPSPSPDRVRARPALPQEPAAPFSGRPFCCWPSAAKKGYRLRVRNWAYSCRASWRTARQFLIHNVTSPPSISALRKVFVLFRHRMPLSWHFWPASTARGARARPDHSISRHCAWLTNGWHEPDPSRLSEHWSHEQSRDAQIFLLK